MVKYHLIKLKKEQRRSDAVAASVTSVLSGRGSEQTSSTMSTLTADDDMSVLDTSNHGKMPTNGLLVAVAAHDDDVLGVLGELEGMNNEDDAPSQQGGDERGVELQEQRGDGLRVSGPSFESHGRRQSK